MKRIGLALAAGALCFALGIAAARLFAEPQEAPSLVVVSPLDAGLGPRIVFDPASVQLLPDASLLLELPPGFDAAAP